MVFFYKVILDANFLMQQFQFDVDIESEIRRLVMGDYEIMVPTIVEKELRGLARNKGKTGMKARMALEFSKRFKRIELEGPTADDALLGLNESYVIICTNDKVLKENVKGKGVPVIYLRQKRFLEIEGYLN